MTVHNPTFKYSTNSLLSQSLHFRRRRGKIKTKKVQRKIRLKFKHILFTFLILGGIFYFIQRIYLFLISWDNMKVKEINVVCQRAELNQQIQQFLGEKNLGNIFLFDVNRLQKALANYRWVKEVSVRKIFPSTLKIEIEERKPAALLEKENLFLIDNQGVLLERIDSTEKMNLPLLIDSNNFEKHYEEKLKLAWECLKSLTPLEKERIAALDLTNYSNIIVQLKESQTKLILGDNRFSQKLQLFRNYKGKLKKYGALEYVDLRFQDRLYIKPQKNSVRDVNLISEKEAR